MQVNIGKNTLGDNDKMSVSLREYDRSTHDLSFAWRSSMGVGTLVPCLKILGTPYRDWETDRKSTRLNSSHSAKSRMPSSA